MARLHIEEMALIVVSVVLDKVATDFFIPISIYLGKAGINSIPGLAEVVFLKTQRVPFGTIESLLSVL